MATSATASSPPVLRFGHPMAFSAFLRDAGAPVDRLLRQQGLPALCDDPDVFVPLHRAWSFFDAAAQQEDPMLGWLVGAYVGDHNLNVSLLRKLESAPTLLQALGRLVTMASAEASHLQLGLHERGDDILLYTHYSGRREACGYLVSQAYQLGVLVDLIRHFLGRRWVPNVIGIECPRVPEPVQDLFPGTRILARQPVGYLSVPRASLHQSARPIDSKGGAGDDPVLSESFDFADTLRAVLKAYLPEGYPSAHLAAALMDTSVRTLSRRLSACGLTYGRLVDELRFTMAKALLHEPGARIGDIAHAVGFEDQAHFTRMFRRIGGVSPREFRVNLRGVNHSIGA